MTKFNWFIVLYVSFSFPVYGQVDSVLIARANKLEHEFKYEESLKIFESLLRKDSSSIMLLNKVSHLLSAQSFNQLPENKRTVLYERSRKYAEKVIRMDPKNAMGYYNLAFALGRLSNNAPVKVKITNAKQIRSAAEKAIALDPHLPGPYHILGRWHRVIAGFNAFERTMISTFYGKGLEGGSYEEALQNFQKAVIMEPANCFHYFEMAITYHERGNENDNERAIAWLKKTLQIKPRNVDEQIKIQKAKEMLKQLEEV